MLTGIAGMMTRPMKAPRLSYSLLEIECAKCATMMLDNDDRDAARHEYIDDDVDANNGTTGDA